MTFMLRQLLKVSIRLRKSIQNVIIIHDYLQKNVSLSNSLELKKWKSIFSRIAVSIWNSIPLSVKTLNISNFRKKIKSLPLNVLGNEGNYLNVNYLIEYFMKFTWYVVYTSSCNFGLFQTTKSPVLEFICKGFLSVFYCFFSFLFSCVT